MVFRGDTTVYNAGSFKTMADDRFAELLKQLPGVEIKPASGPAQRLRCLEALATA